MASDKLSLAELRNKGRDDIKAIVRQSNILFGNQFWQGIKSLLHAAIDASEEEKNNDGTKVRRVVDRDALLLCMPRRRVVVVPMHHHYQLLK